MVTEDAADIAWDDDPLKHVEESRLMPPYTSRVIMDKHTPEREILSIIFLSKTRDNPLNVGHPDFACWVI
jgi:hypothetical protein